MSVALALSLESGAEVTILSLEKMVGRGPFLVREAGSVYLCGRCFLDSTKNTVDYAASLYLTATSQRKLTFWAWLYEEWITFSSE